MVNPRLRFHFLPIKVMAQFHTVYLSYRVTVDSDTKGEAYRKICKALKADPKLFITRVECGSGEDRKRRPLWKMFLLG